MRTRSRKQSHPNIEQSPLVRQQIQAEVDNNSGLHKQAHSHTNKQMPTTATQQVHSHTNKRIPTTASEQALSHTNKHTPTTARKQTQPMNLESVRDMFIELFREFKPDSLSAAATTASTNSQRRREPEQAAESHGKASRGLSSLHGKQLPCGFMTVFGVFIVCARVRVSRATSIFD
jgi:hypothetical protein